MAEATFASAKWAGLRYYLRCRTVLLERAASNPSVAKAVAIMVNYAGLGDLYRICLEAQRAGANFNVAYIGGDFQAEHKVQFEQEYMRALYRFGYEKAVKGYPWGRAPPGF